MKRKRKEKNSRILLAKIVVYAGGAVTILLILYVVSLSFFGMGELSQSYGGALNEGSTAYCSLQVIPSQFRIEQYKNTLWRNSDFWFYFWNSVGICLPVLVVTGLFGTLGGYSFARFRFRGRKALLFLFILFMMIPSQVLIPSQFRVLYEMNLLNHMVSVILPNMFAPFGVYLMYQYAGKMPEDMFEAAAMDGAGELRIFFSIVLPEIKNGIAALLILTLIDIWNLIEQPLIFYYDKYKMPVSAAMNQFGISNVLSPFVGCVIDMIPIFLVFLLGKEQLIEGIGQSVIKIKGGKG